MTCAVFDSPALPLLLELEAQGFTVSVSSPGGLDVKPGSRLTDEQRRLLVEQKTHVLTILRCCADGVTERRDTFRRQFEHANAPQVPVLQFRPGVPYTVGICFSCGDANGRQAFGRCWRCSLALRLALRWPISADLVQALDDARVA